MDSGHPGPIEPAPTTWLFPDIAGRDVDSRDVEGRYVEGLVAIGADLEPGTLLEAYRRGMFPMPLSDHSTMGWWSPDPRGVIEVGDLHVSRSLRKSMKSFDITINENFEEVVHSCADPARPQGWITVEIQQAYERLHQLGWAHSLEVREGTELVGGLYGVGIGSFFAGESMFHRRNDASKAAVVALVETLAGLDNALFDVQWTTPHLVSLGAVDMGRSDYLLRLESAIAADGPVWPRPR